MIRPSGSVNRGRFKRFERVHYFCLKTTSFQPFFFFFPFLYGVVQPLFFLTLSPKHSETLTLSITRNLTSLIHSLVSTSIPRRRRSSLVPPPFHPSFGSAQIAVVPPLFDLKVSITLSPSQLSPDRSSLTHAHLCLSPSSPSPSFGTLLPLICIFFVNICKLIVDDDIDLKCWCVN